MIEDTLQTYIQDAFTPVLGDVEVPETIHFEHPVEMTHGDFSTNIAMVLAQKLGTNPRDLAQNIVEKLQEVEDDAIAKIEVAGPGFINFYLTPHFLVKSVDEVLTAGDSYGSNESLKDKKVMVEYTDPNPFKEFHIGHLMTNTIGESLARVLAFSGADVHRANYQGDTGMHVAKALYGMLETKDDMPSAESSLSERAQYLGGAYALGGQAYEDESSREKIKEINKHVFEKDSEEINELYEKGRAWSLEYFETIYARLGTAFDHFYFESGTGNIGKRMVEENLGTIFKNSDGATIFPGEDFGLHTRVFMNSEGLPTYEAKELGLAKLKFDDFPYDQSFVVTGNEITEYFKVLMKALGQIHPDLSARTRHIPHGMLRLTGGKMSSRTGDVITAVSVLDEAKEAVLAVMKDNADFGVIEKEVVADAIAVGAVKYSILRQSSGKDIIFDFETSLSFDGNSGPYLQYTYARAQSILEKAGDIIPKVNLDTPPEMSAVERLLYRFPEVVKHAAAEYESHHIATYLFELAQAYNTYYAQHKILDGSADTPYRLALTGAVATVLKNGMALLGIAAVEKM